MELFERAKTVRLRSEKGKYLMAEEDEESVIQHRHGSSRAARWSVELLPESGLIRLKSCYGKYLTASYDHEPFGFTGGLLHGGGGGPPHRKHKVVQSLPQRRLDCSVDWEPIRSTTGDNSNNQLVKLRSRHGTFLRSNGPWRKSVTHDHLIITTTHHPKAMLWDVAIMEILVTSSSSSSPEKITINPPPAPPSLLELDFERPPPLFSASRNYNQGRTKYYRTTNPKTREEIIVVCRISPLNSKLQIVQIVPLL